MIFTWANKQLISLASLRVGMGIGFLLMGIIHAKKITPAPVTISLPRSLGQIALFGAMEPHVGKVGRKEI